MSVDAPLGLYLWCRLAGDTGALREVLGLLATTAWWPERPGRAALGSALDGLCEGRNLPDGRVGDTVSVAATGHPEPARQLQASVPTERAQGRYPALRAGVGALLRHLAERPGLRLTMPLVVGAAGVHPPLLRPPRSNAWWLQGFVHVTADTMRASPNASLARSASAVLDATPPHGVLRERIGPLTVDEWHTDPTDLAGLEDALARQEAWYTLVLGLPPLPGWNEAGDQQILPLGFLPAPAPLLWYVPAEERGLLPVAPEPDGPIPRHVVAAVAPWRAERRLPDGRPLDRVDLIFPRREDAARLRPEAKALGFARTLYADERGLWNLHPLARWWTGAR